MRDRKNLSRDENRLSGDETEKRKNRIHLGRDETRHTGDRKNLLRVFFRPEHENK
jgi:hypothetical protein